MRRIILSSILAAASAVATMAQTIYICKDGSYTKQEIADGLEIALNDGIDSITFHQPAIEKVVSIAFNGNTAQVNIPSFIEGVTCTSGNNPDVVLSSTNVTDEIIYDVTGSTTDGSLTINGSYKLTMRLNGVSIASSKQGAINIACGKRIALVMADGSVNTLSDAANGTHKACLYTKGHLELSGAGTLNVTGNSNHAIASKEYFQVKRSVKAINILKAANDAIHAGQYIQVNGGEINITSTTTNDAMQAEYKLDDNNAIIQDPENTGNIIVKGGTINIELSNSQDSKGLKAEGDIIISGGTFKIDALSNGSRGMQTDANMVINQNDASTSITINAKGTKCTLAEDAADPHNCMGMKVDGNLTINDATIKVYNTGKKAKGIKVKGTCTINGVVKGSGNINEGNITATIENK